MNPEELEGLDPEVAAPRLLQPGAVEADRRDPRRAGREPADRVPAVLGDPGARAASTAMLTLGNLNPSIADARPDDVRVGDRAGRAGRWGAAARRPDRRGRRASGDGRIGDAQRSLRIAAPARRPRLPRGTPVQLTVRRAGRTLTLSRLSPLQQAEAQRMLVGFGFGAAPNRSACSPRPGSRRSEMWSVTTRPDLGHRHGVHELEGPPRSPQHRRHHRDRPRNGRRRRRLRARVPRLHLADPRGDQPVPVPAARRRARRSGRWPRRCAGGGSRSPRCGATAPSGSCCSRSWSSTASATTSAAWAADGCAPAGYESGAHAHPALDQRPDALGQRRAEQRLHLGAAAAARSPPTRRPRPAASRGGAARGGSQWANGSSEWGSIGNEQRGRLHEPAAAHAAHLRGERRAARGRDVLDHARAVHEVELARRRTAGPRRRPRARTAPGSPGARRDRRR